MALVFASGGQGGGSGTVQSVTAADTSIVVAGTAANPTVATGTLDVIAADHAPVADWSNNGHKITDVAAGTASSDVATVGQIPAEIGYDEITSSVNVTSTSEASGTVVIAGSAYTFDGDPVICEFFAPFLNAPAAHALIVCLFEGTTEITRLAAGATGSLASPIDFPTCARYRFTPVAGSHTYSLTAFISGGSSAFVQAGPGGTAAYAPAYLRFTKV